MIKLLIAAGVFGFAISIYNAETATKRPMIFAEMPRHEQKHVQDIGKPIRPEHIDRSLAGDMPMISMADLRRVDDPSRASRAELNMILEDVK